MLNTDIDSYKDKSDHTYSINNQNHFMNHVAGVLSKQLQSSLILDYSKKDQTLYIDCEDAVYTVLLLELINYQTAHHLCKDECINFAQKAIKDIVKSHAEGSTLEG